MPVLEELREELETYEANRERLLGEAARKYVLVHGTEIVGTFDTEGDAIAAGYQRFGNVAFLVKRVTPIDEPANFLSGVLNI